MKLIYILGDLLISYWKDILKVVIETLVIYLVVRFRYRSNKDVIIFPQNVIDKLVAEFDPDDLVKDVPSDVMLPSVYKEGMVDLANFDVFGLAMENKKEIVEAIRKYGVGTCGPRGFYGTLDIHLDLERTISRELGAEASIVYPNSFIAVNSIIACFCKQQDIVFYHEDCNEAILRGIGLSKSKNIEFASISDLEIKLEYFTRPKVRNFVIIEGLSKNTGKIVDIKKILELRDKYKFRIILDESYAIPLLNKRGVCGANGVSIKEIDITIGSLSGGLCCGGAFSLGTYHAVDYQKLSGSSYCFSASLPGALAKAAILNIQREFDYEGLRNRVELFHATFESKTYEIMSSPLSPIVIVVKKREVRRPMSREALLKEVLDIRSELLKNGIIVGFNHNPYPSLRICLKAKIPRDDVTRLAVMLNKW
ncbi:serine palmitoyltransferase subunit 1 [Encephalitozoon intestinalis ATCC 50506]|uniref:serine C-palmitoyltransferase n=1 Tax=Encephalitozoon intestinalis (strain ATCC 50506) TaxID=876142 RepID=E0S5U4_ENCIT|nr:serine palmitoyltransferase subunit 1 [Encephalitozoon intestinalis ATCC 50506]ADM11079.1 serine palmitoyltransferase subunit 1 [Encephalitozoon intestinalis ATCC 50506]UTX44731.1 aminolevulinate synthase [Encephalitozoon intestinalis]